MNPERFAPGDLVEATSIHGIVLGRGIVIKVGAGGSMLVIEFEEAIPGTNRRTDVILAENCRKVGERTE
jgi:hypothetical protein